jgi:hypothetical protein
LWVNGITDSSGVEARGIDTAGGVVRSSRREKEGDKSHLWIADKRHEDVHQLFHVCRRGANAIDMKTLIVAEGQKILRDALKVLLSEMDYLKVVGENYMNCRLFLRRAFKRMLGERERFR